MATFDDNWQTKRPTISKRTKFIFNNELLSDVKFVAHYEKFLLNFKYANC